MILALPLLISLIMFVWSRGRFAWQEFATLVLVSVAVVGAGYAIGSQQSISDVEIVSGRITEKVRQRISCRHSYSCNCVTVSCGKDCSTTQCQTCYDHSYDVQWLARTNAMDNTIYFDTLDRQGLHPGAEWHRAYVGEPVAFQHSYDNYIKAHPESVLRQFTTDYSKYQMIPYPDDVNGYRINRFRSLGYEEQHAADWNWHLSEIAGDLGPTKQVEPIVVAVKSADPTYEYAFQHAWLGGKKNDVVILLGVPEYPKISWVRIMSWTDREDLKVELRDALMNIGTMDQRDQLLQEIRNQLQTKFQRMHMKNYEYLLSQYEPGAGLTMFLFVLALLLNIGGSIYFHLADPFGIENTYRNTYRKRMY
jgi:hypothetical protein